MGNLFDPVEVLADAAEDKIAGESSGEGLQAHLRAIAEEIPDELTIIGIHFSLTFLEHDRGNTFLQRRGQGNLG